MARLDGREPCSYLLDPRVNFVPELLAGYEGKLGRHALCFTAALPHGMREFVALSDGGGSTSSAPAPSHAVGRAGRPALRGQASGLLLVLDS